MYRCAIGLRGTWLVPAVTLALAGCSANIGIEHTTEEIAFDSGRFHLFGELRRPAADKVYPVVIFVHGDGSATSTRGGFYFPTMERCLKAGYACFSYDKPGSGRSTGEFDRRRLRRERADILADVVEVLKRHPSVDPHRIGLWGISQAGWVMPLALEMTDDIAFMIVVSGGGEDGIEQMGYLISRQAVCAGYSQEDARRLDSLWVACLKAQTYEEYARHGLILVNDPVVQNLGCFERVSPARDWSPLDPDDEGWLNPIPILRQTPIPVLAFFGEKDTQVDPVQGRKAYEAALKKGGNTYNRVELIEGVNHNMFISETGCMNEAVSFGFWADGQAPEYLDLLERWLRELPSGT